MKRYRIWYSDGEWRMGWLHFEGHHGRSGPVAEYDEEVAKEQVELESKHDPDLEFSLVPVDATDAEEEAIVTATRKRARAKQQQRWSG